MDEDMQRQMRFQISVDSGFSGFRFETAELNRILRIKN